MEINLDTFLESKEVNSKKYVEDSIATQQETAAVKEAALMDIVSAPDKYQTYLNLAANLRDYTAGNTALVYAADPNATCVKTKDAWKRVRRYLLDPDKAFNIFAPGKKGYTEVKEAFDISNTRGEDYNDMRVDLSNDQAMKAAIEGLVHFAGCKIEPTANEKENGVYFPDSRTVKVLNNASADKMFTALVTGLAFSNIHKSLKLGHFETKYYAFDAKSIAYILSKRYNVPMEFAEVSKITKIYGKPAPDMVEKILNTNHDVIKKMSNTIERATERFKGDHAKTAYMQRGPVK